MSDAEKQVDDNNRTNAVVLGGTGMRLLLLSENLINLLDAYVNAANMVTKDRIWLGNQRDFLMKLREVNPKE